MPIGTSSARHPPFRQVHLWQLRFHVGCLPYLRLADGLEGVPITRIKISIDEG
jgi:hypothetical protein